VTSDDASLTLLGVSSLLPRVGQSMATSQLLVHWVEMPRGSSNVLLKKSLCLPYHGLCTWHSSSAPTLLWQAWRLTCGSPRHPCHCHGEAWDKNSVGVMVPTLSWMASRWASVDRSWAEPRWELSQTDANKNTMLVAWRRWLESPPVGGTSCPHRRW
jgi:hypothetical protein